MVTKLNIVYLPCRTNVRRAVWQVHWNGNWENTAQLACRQC